MLTLFKARALLVPAVLLLASLAACGGGSDDNSTPTPAASVSPTVSAAGTPSPTPGSSPTLRNVQLDVQQFPNQGQEHLQFGEVYDDYNSNPPTSGPHSPVAADWGVYRNEVPKEVLVHDMEHGGVVVWYNCNAGQPLTTGQCTDLQTKLSTVVVGYIRAGRNAVMSPYSGMDNRIALTAWTKLMVLDDFDETKVGAFIEQFERLFNPEGF